MEEWIGDIDGGSQALDQDVANTYATDTDEIKDQSILLEGAGFEDGQWIKRPRAGWMTATKRTRQRAGRQSRSWEVHCKVTLRSS